jgi:hypothetical protein
MASDETQIANGAATLDGTDFNRVTWAAVEGAAKYNVYRSTAGGTPGTTGLIGTVSDLDTLQLDDTGLAASGSEPSEDRSGAVIIGTGSNGTNKLLNVQEETTDDSTVTSLITLSRESVNTVLAGFGTGIYTRLLDAVATMRAAGSLHFLWTDPGAALKTAFRVMLRDGGTQLVERFRVNPDGSIELSGTEVIGIGTCRQTPPIDGGVRGGTTGASTNNDIAAIRFDNGGDGWNRINIKAPGRYTSGDLTFRLYCSVPSTVGANKGTRWRLDWSLKSIADALGSWSYTNEFTYDISSQTLDTVFAIDFTITAAQFDKTKDLLCMKMTRLGTDAADDCNVHIYVHGLELRFTGYQFGGQ